MILYQYLESVKGLGQRETQSSSYPAALNELGQVVFSTSYSEVLVADEQRPDDVFLLDGDESHSLRIVN